MNRIFIRQSEVLLVFLKNGQGNYIPETELGHRHSVDSALEMMCQDGSEYQAIRFDPESMTGEDVTNDLAMHWMEQNPTLMHEHFAGLGKGDTIPKFVRDSEFFEQPEHEPTPTRLGAREFGVGQFA